MKTSVTQRAPFQQHHNTKKSSDGDADIQPNDTVNKQSHMSKTSFDGRVQDLLVILPNGPAHPVQLQPREGEDADHDDQTSYDIID